MILWEFPNPRQLVQLGLSQYGKVIGEIETPHSRIYTLDAGEHVEPRYLIAKAAFVHGLATTDYKRAMLNVLHEVNFAYRVCHHPLIHRFSRIEVLWGIPFLISAKREKTLFDLIAFGPLPVVDALLYVIQIAHALEYMADRGINCHQDLKPENVLIDPISGGTTIQNRILVADFELSNAFLLLRHPYGSRPYMAPEQYNFSRTDVHHEDFIKVDVFALGVILFEMLTGGRHPIGEETRMVWPSPVGTKGNKWKRETPWKKWVRAGAKIARSDDVNEDAVDIVRQCLRLDVDHRPSMAAIKADFLELLGKHDLWSLESIRALLGNFDEIARKSEDLGWPYYDDLVAKINRAFDQERPNLS